MLSSQEKCVIIGASHAAAQLVLNLRQGGWNGYITVIGDEAEYPYHRPPLSKAVLSGEKNVADILIRPIHSYETLNVEMKLGVRVDRIDRKNKFVMTNKGDKISYSKLVLTTGARVRLLPVPGADLPGIFYLRNAGDVQAIQSQIHAGRHAVIIGGGYIGLETAASLKKQGLNVTVLEATPRILQRVTAPELSVFYKRVHSEEGVIIHENSVVCEIQKNHENLRVLTEDGATFEADIVIVGIGVIPNCELAAEIGLKINNGIEIDEFCCTSDPDIYAAGDVTWHHNKMYDRHLRLESVPNATEQAKIVAAALNGKPVAYNSLPWFWSDQFDLKLQIAGLSEGYDAIIIRGDIEGSRSFAAFYFKGDKLIAVDAVNRPREFMASRMALSRGQTLRKEHLSDEAVDIKQMIK